MTENDKTNNQEGSFENAYAELENIVKRMEMGEQGLEESLGDFEKGIQLIQQCHQHLQKAEQRIQVIQQSDNGAIQSKPFDKEPN